MNEKDLIRLGFERQDVGIEETGDKAFHYYTWKAARGLELISCSSDETEIGEWWVEFFDTDPIVRFIQSSEVEALIQIIEKGIVTENPSE